jgi:hypothetical protein
LAHQRGSLASRLGWLWPALAGLFALAPVLFWGGGVIEEEALAFQRNFWGSRPVLERIFETREFDDYQGRELSYAIDCLDAQWIRALLSRGVLLFVAPSVLLASLALVPIGLWLVPAALPGLERGSRWLVLLLYLSNFAVASTTGLLYRATKPLVAPLLLVLLLLLLAEQRRPGLGRGAAFLATFATSLAMSLLDRQGLFYVLLLAAVLGAVWLRTRRASPWCSRSPLRCWPVSSTTTASGLADSLPERLLARPELPATGPRWLLALGRGPTRRACWATGRACSSAASRPAGCWRRRRWRLWSGPGASAGTRDASPSPSRPWPQERSHRRRWSR